MASVAPIPGSPSPFEAIQPSLNSPYQQRINTPRSTRKQATTPRRTPSRSPNKRSSSQGSANEVDENQRLEIPTHSTSPLKSANTPLRSAMKQLRINTPSSVTLRGEESDSPTLFTRKTTNTFNSYNPQTSPLRSPTKTLRFFENINASPLDRREESDREEEADVERDSSDDSASESDWQTDAEDPSTPIRKPLSSLPSYLLPQTPSAYRFSPSTPSVRTHKSYEEDELTDCDADGSIWEEEGSFNYASAGVSEELEVMEEESETVIEDEEWIEEEDQEQEEIVEETETSEIEMDVVRIEEGECPEPMFAAEAEVGEKSAEEDTKDKFCAIVEGEGCETIEEESAPVTREGEETGQTTDEIEETVAKIEGEMLPASEETVDHDGRPETPERNPSPTLDNPPSPLLPSSHPAFESTLPSSPIALAKSPRAVLQTTAPVTTSLASPLPTSTTPKKPSAFAPIARTAQSQVHDAPTARRQLTKLSSLATKRSFDSLNDPKRRTALTAMVPGSAAGTSRKIVPTTKTSLGTPSHAPGIPRPTPSSSSVSRLAAPSSIRSRTLSDSTTSRLATVKENNPPTKSKLSSSLPPSSSSMRPPTSTIPRPRPLVKSGLKPPSSLSSSRTVPTPSTRGVPPPRPIVSSTKLMRPMVLNTSRPAIPSALSRLHRPETAPSSSEFAKPLSASLSASTAPNPRPLPSLQQTSSAPALLPSRGPTPPLQQAAQLPPVPRSARPVKIDRTAVIPATSHTSKTTNTLHAISARSPQKRKVETVESDPTRPTVSSALSQPLASVETPIKPPRIESTLASQPLPTSPATPKDLPLAASSPSHAPSTFTTRSSPISRRPPTTSASPLRSPRRVPLNQPPPPAFPASTPSALVLPAERLVAVSSSLDVFGSNPNPLPPSSLPPIPVAQLPVRSARPRRAKQAEDEPSSSAPAIPVPTKRITRRTAAVPTLPTPSAPPTLPTGPLIPRSSRRPPKPVAPVLVEESEPSSLSSSSSSSSASNDEPPTPATSFLFNPAPSVTQEELNRLTQRNTKKNQQSFNKLKIETVFIESNRPPSPTSKIRKSFGGGEGGVGKPTTKEGREARAAKRRNALRSSTDGSELEALRGELGNGESMMEKREEVVHHYRAPGDEEQFCSPMRPVKKSGGKKKSSTTTTAATKKTLRWDKALVYEGPKDDALEETAASGIIKALPLDQWGNSTETSTNFAKPSPVVIRKRVFKDDEQ